MAGINSEWWPASNWNGGRNDFGIGGRLRSEFAAKIVEEIDLGARLPFAGAPDMTLVGEALHRFLAADDPAFEADRRLAMATRLLAAWGVIGLDPRDVVTMSNRFWKFVADRWPGASLRREAPIVQIRGN